MSADARTGNKTVDAEHEAMEALLLAWNPYTWPKSDNITSTVSPRLMFTFHPYSQPPYESSRAANLRLTTFVCESFSRPPIAHHGSGAKRMLCGLDDLHHRTACAATVRHALSPRGLPPANVERGEAGHGPNRGEYL